MRISRHPWVSLALIALSAAVVLPAGSAQAATVLRMRSVPAHPVVGASTVVQFTTLAPTVDNGDQPFALPADYPWRVEAVAPDRAVRSLRMVRTDEPTVWEGNFTPTTAGTWTIRVTNFAPQYNPRDGAVLKVGVVARGARLPFTGAQSALLGVAGGGMLLLGAALVGAARRRGRRGQVS